jgi:hypothetical protein
MGTGRQEKPRRDHQGAVRDEDRRYLPGWLDDAAILIRYGPARPQYSGHDHIMAESVAQE